MCPVSKISFEPPSILLRISKMITLSFVRFSLNQSTLTKGSEANVFNENNIHTVYKDINVVNFFNFIIFSFMDILNETANKC